MILIAFYIWFFFTIGEWCISYYFTPATVHEWVLLISGYMGWLHGITINKWLHGVATPPPPDGIHFFTPLMDQNIETNILFVQFDCDHA